MRSVRRWTGVRWSRWRSRSPGKSRRRYWLGMRPRWRRFARIGGRWDPAVWCHGHSGGWNIDRPVTVYLDRCAVLTSVVLMEDVVLVVYAVLLTTHIGRGVPAPFQVKEDKVSTLEEVEDKVSTLEEVEDKVSILEAVEDRVSTLDHKVLVAPVFPLGEVVGLPVEAVEVPVEGVEGRLVAVQGEGVVLCANR